MNNCCRCGEQIVPKLGKTTSLKIKGREYCIGCSTIVFDKEISTIPITSTNSIEGSRIVKYIDIASAEVVAGTGLFSEFQADIADTLGGRATAFEIKLSQAKKTALDKLKYLAYEKGGNAVVGVDIDYMEMSNNKLGIVANGTIVQITKGSVEESNLLDTF